MQCCPAFQLVLDIVCSAFQPPAKTESLRRIWTMAKTPISLDSLPSEVRLRILQYTHLGLSGTGGYDSRFERMRISGGTVIPRYNSILEPNNDDLWFVCPSHCVTYSLPHA